MDLIQQVLKASFRPLEVEVGANAYKYRSNFFSEGVKRAKLARKWLVRKQNRASPRRWVCNGLDVFHSRLAFFHHIFKQQFGTYNPLATIRFPDQHSGSSHIHIG